MTCVCNYTVWFTSAMFYRSYYHKRHYSTFLFYIVKENLFSRVLQFIGQVVVKENLETVVSLTYYSVVVVYPLGP